MGGTPGTRAPRLHCGSSSVFVGNRSQHQSVPGASCKVSVGHRPPSKGSGSPEGCAGKFLELRVQGCGTALALTVASADHAGWGPQCNVVSSPAPWKGAVVSPFYRQETCPKKVKGLSWAHAGCEGVVEPRFRPGPRLKVCSSLYWSAWAAITKDCRLGAFNNRNLCLSPEAGTQTSRCWQYWLPRRLFSLACRWPPSRCVFTGSQGHFPLGIPEVSACHPFSLFIRTVRIRAHLN